MELLSKGKLVRLLLGVLIVSGLLAGCTLPGTQGNQAAVSAAITPTPTKPAAVPTTTPVADKNFTLEFNSGFSLNPIFGADPNNTTVSSLMYEGLFKVSDNFEAIPVLCDSFTTDDGITYNFTLKSGIAMTDGSTMTATDVAYSINKAKTSSKYSSRLACISSVTAADNLHVTIKLSKANYCLVLLLDVPIVKNGSGDDNTPIGTGPYVYTGGNSPKLTVFSGYRSIALLRLDTIYLKSVSDSKLSEEFSSKNLDLLQFDPNGTLSLNVSIDYEAHYYNTTMLQYLGFNMNHTILSSPSLRKALGNAVDRDTIVSSVMGGHALASQLIFSPAWKLYDTSWAGTSSYSLQTLSSLFESLQMKDYDNNGYLEYLSGQNTYKPFHLDFIVNTDNRTKVTAAKKIAETLKSVGIDITLKELSWSDFQKALSDGNFDLYYGEVKLPSDFDVTQLLVKGGTLNYGGITDTKYEDLINAYLGAKNDSDCKTAAGALSRYVAENAPIIPILYKKYEVMTHRDTVTGIDPTQSNIFNNITQWKVTMG